ncbi:aminoglycoside N3'-acetyltransferase [Sphaerochaeta pleomorpha str. Grapes]|uniref:Aminoglycoside N(3)-acetyltransferase n=1 Tax=Sphaerochaeta pleomorpha (strain ATCC BAA-1885 / DSM 22778 / Grapes) TaxID=158190 RepID=G8QVP1_SPHPG|nr:AAC(3) family N-acetyltransferase [Sphaerochaeta pleomorpha]AEV29333.1 aminoglycoside N3'-acetyltransferase [Sphaerochaeta pleomorpha str. Grapes]
MYTKENLLENLRQLGINPKGTILVHASYKSIGEVENGADTVIEALIDYMHEGLLVFPSHTWATVDANNPVYSVNESPACIGIIPELARKKPGGFRSGHPTHSVVAFGKDAKTFVQDDEHFDTPCARASAWGKLLDRDATILLVGVGLNRDTFIHGIEEWLDLPERLTKEKEMLTSILADGTAVTVPSRRHIGHPSENFPKVQDYLFEKHILHNGTFGDAKVLYHSTQELYDALEPLLEKNPALFS